MTDYYCSHAPASTIVKYKRPHTETNINDIRNATNQSWVLGEGVFKESVQLQLVKLARQVEPATGSQLNLKSIEADHIDIFIADPISA